MSNDLGSLRVATDPIIGTLQWQAVDRRPYGGLSKWAPIRGKGAAEDKQGLLPRHSRLSFFYSYAVVYMRG
jgi:hypothetical protein